MSQVIFNEDVSMEVTNASLQIGQWLYQNLSLEGIIALPALLISLLIALAIYNFEDSKSKLEIDAATLIATVVDIKMLVRAIVYVSFLAIFWNESPLSLGLIPFFMVIYIGGVAMIVQSLNRSVTWAKTIDMGMLSDFKTKSRAKYLSQLSDREKVSAWSKIWHSEDNRALEILNQRDLVKIFVDNIRTSEDKTSIAPMVDDFIRSIDKIDLSDPIILESILSVCLEDGSNMVSKNYKNPNNPLHYRSSLRRLYFEILKRVMQKNDNGLYSFIETSRKFIKEGDWDESYFVRCFAPNFLSNLNKENRSWVWDSFPEEWLITYAQLRASNKVTTAWFNAYMRWVTTRNLRMENNSAGIDTILESATEHIFPKADPMTLGSLIVFHYAAYGSNEGEDSEHAQVRNYAETTATFGHMGRVHMGFADEIDKTWRQTVQQEREEAVRIATATTAFGAIQNQKTREKYLSIIKNMRKDYANDSDEEHKLNRIEDELRLIAKTLSDKEKKE